MFSDAVVQSDSGLELDSNSYFLIVSQLELGPSRLWLSAEWL